ncbi:MAG TPA: magnesium-translocating P-type ATPase [Gemmatimonadaceae bacterium]|jgi:Mg2+-importing ATPase|nr:magnesium-translocating P-type ATPase [Gemmatimonadaceae bacterium]
MTSPSTSAIRVSPELTELGHLDPADVLHRLETSPRGISEVDAARRLARYGPNEVAAQRPPGWPRRLVRTCVNPLVILLTALAIVSLVSGDRQAASVMTLMILLGVTLRFVQESRADAAAERLKAMIRVTATVLRDGIATEVPLRDLVPGDVVQLSAGDMIPADIRLVETKDLYINQASLTGESLPVEKTHLLEAPTGSALELPTLCFLGTSVESGTATAVVVTTGAKTYFGRMARSITQQPSPTAFDRGVSQFTWLMIGLMSIMVPLVFFINGFTKHDWREAFFFALAVAVGLTPEMLPMIVSVCLSKGAMAMSRKAVIVKRLNAIQNVGAMDVLCTDKTGTLTMDKVILERYCDVTGTPNDTVLQLAVLISAFQTGLKNVLDRAILDHHEPRETVTTVGYRKLDEIPFDFTRKLMSVVVATPEGTTRLLSKGAPEEIFKRCGFFESAGTTYPIESAFLEDLREEYLALSVDGFRVLAVAYRTVAPKAAYGKDDETDLVLAGYVAFLDPPKDTCAAAVAALEKSGVQVKILTGDNDLVTRKICSQVGVATDHMLLGPDIECMSDAELAHVVDLTTVFARVSPAHKQRIITALQSLSHVVGFLGDGINDAPALRVADVGISVDTAVDVAKASADIILLQKSLMVLHDGVLEGRKVFSNILKYVRMGASSNFGNMFSVLGASAWLPFVPMAPIQVLTNNLLYDFSQVPIPTDHVDPEQIAAPRPWAIGQIRRFILLIGPISSIFDYTTFLVMFFLFHAATPARASLFQTGWFVESLMTQTLIIHVIRTNKIPFLQSRPSWPLIATTVGIMVVGLCLPMSPLAPALGFVHLPGLYWPILLLTLAAYMGLTQGVKAWMLRRAWI